MSVWKQITHLTQLELRSNVSTPLLSFVYAFALLVIFSGEKSFDQSIIIDIVFIALFSGGFTFMAKTDRFKPQVIRGNMYTSLQVIFLQQIPASRQAIIYSRIIMHNVYNIIIQILFIFPLYLLPTGFNELMPASVFIIFLIMWMSLGVFASGFTAADEAGKFVNNRSFITTMIQVGIVGILLFLLYRYTPFTIIGASIYIASHWPVLACVGAVVFASSGILYGQYKMNRTLQTMDYM